MLGGWKGRRRHGLVEKGGRGGDVPRSSIKERAAARGRIRREGGGGACMSIAISEKLQSLTQSRGERYKKVTALL